MEKQKTTINMSEIKKIKYEKLWTPIVKKIVSPFVFVNFSCTDTKWKHVLDAFFHMFTYGDYLHTEVSNIICT